MNDYTVPPDPSTPPSAVPPTPPPARKGAPWGKIALFGCLGLLVIAIILAVLGFFVYKMRDRSPVTTYETSEGETTDLSQGGTTTHSGTLVAGDEVAPDGSWYDEYPVQLSSGGRFIATLRSTDFDAYLIVVAPSGATMSDDDGGGGTDSRIERTVDESGTWLIRANTLRAGQTGAYTLTIETVP